MASRNQNAVDAPDKGVEDLTMGAVQDPNSIEAEERQEQMNVDTEEEQAGDSDSKLVEALFSISSKHPKLIRSSAYDVVLGSSLSSSPLKSSGNDSTHDGVTYTYTEADAVELKPKVPQGRTVKIRSWRMNEFKYYDVPTPFPTLARGLFTRELDEQYAEDREAMAIGGKKKHQIIVRGYDKFFNIGEVPWVNWDALPRHTSAPYTLTLKSNGCIIFIAALTPSQLVVTSKHSMGAVEQAMTESKMSHAQAGEKWLRQYLEAKGKTEGELAKKLWDEDWTAVAELCDDTFEEHVLAYPPHLTGLHLHGLNKRTKAFNTEPQHLVDAFAEEWGFIKTKSISLDTIEEVQKFTGECAELGEWQGEKVEGFVVRTHVSEGVVKKGLHPGEALTKAEELDIGKTGKGKSKQIDRSAPPYPPHSSFFFKVKFDEPYMMYRDWREVTKMLLSAAYKSSNKSRTQILYLHPPGLTPSSLPKNKMKRPETRVYVDWVIDEMKRDLSQFETYNKGKGIIATRERFLKWVEETEEGKKKMEKALKDAKNEASGAGTEVKKTKGPEKFFEKTIIVPVAIPGCGKTAVSVALTHILNSDPQKRYGKWGHTQSDDVQAKKAGPVFVKNVIKLVEECDVVIADKNNHLIQHRTALREAASKFANGNVPIRLLALDWEYSSQPPAMMHRICADRVLDRGQNHQTLRAGVKNLLHEGKSEEEIKTMQDEADRAYEEVLWLFLSTAEALTPAEVDAVVDMDVEDTLEESVKRALKGILPIIYPEQTKTSEDLEKWMPSVEAIKEGVEKAKAYKPSVIKPDDTKAKKKKKLKEGEKEDFGGGDARYFGLLPEVDLQSIIDLRLASANVSVEETKKFWTSLKSSGRIARRPHVTIVHRNSLTQSGDIAELDKELWKRCVALQDLGIVGSVRQPIFRGRLGKLLCDGRVLALTFEDFGLDSSDSSDTEDEARTQGQEGVEFASRLPEHVRNRMHITVGTKEASIQGVEAKGVVERWKNGEKNGLWAVDMDNVWTKGRVKGLNN